MQGQQLDAKRLLLLLGAEKYNSSYWQERAMAAEAKLAESTPLEQDEIDG